MFRISITVVLTVLFIIGCSKGPESGLDMSNIDNSIRAQDDLYQYLNGKWLEKTEIPADKSNYGTFTELYDQSQIDLRTIIEESANSKNKIDGSDEQKVGDFYLSYMDSNLVEKLGINPLKIDLAVIYSVNSRNDLAKLIGQYQKIGIQRPFSFFIDQDLKQSDQYISYIGQSGLGLPDRDYYFKEDQKFSEIREKYISYITDLLSLAPISNPRAKADRIMEIETDLASGHWTRVENRDMNKTYNKFSLKELKKLAPNFDWPVYLEAANLTKIEDLVVRQPTYFKHFNQVYNKVSVEEWKDYLVFKLLSDKAPLLSKNFVDLNFNFYGTTISGTETNRSRWKRAVSGVNNLLGEMVGKVYVKKYFKPEAKTRMVQLVENLRESYAKRIEKLDWMSAETKKEALKKLNKFEAKIGYPDKWKDYSNLVIKDNDLVGNYNRSSIVEYDREVKKLGQPIDRTEWHMTPQTVNAYYNPPMNEVVFPAAILQPPFFNMAAEDAVNYGAIGAAIGHELTHGFDDQGRKTDGDGNLRDWWTKEDEEKFNKRANILISQFDGFNPVDTMHVNGELTLGENIADLGGLTISYYAYKMSLGGNEAPVIDGMTGKQRFFAGWAQVWRRKYRDEELRRRILTDSHSPSRYRVIGVMPNMPEYYAAFDVKEGDKLYFPENERVKIW
jgi:endothelin-converting enzyme